jgi:hypothetical protein
MSRNPTHQKNPIFQQPDNRDRRPHSCPVKHLPLKDFDTWEAIATKTYPSLKTFIYKAYGWCLAAIELRSMLGRMVMALNRISTTFWMEPMIWMTIQ